MENQNILTTEEALVKATAALQAAAAELAAATESLSKAAAGSAAPTEDGEDSSQVVSEVEKTAEEENAEGISEEIETEEQEENAESEEPEEEAAPEAAAPGKTGAAGNVIFTIIRLLLVAALVFAIVFYVFLRNQESTAKASDVFYAVTSKVTTDKIQQTTERYFKKYYGLNAADYDSVLYYAPVSNMDAEELLVVKLKSTEQAEAVTDAILKRQADKEQSFEGYAPEQYALSQEYILDVQGNYILFVIDPEAEKIDSAFAGAL